MSSRPILIFEPNSRSRISKKVKVSLTPFQVLKRKAHEALAAERAGRGEDSYFFKSPDAHIPSAAEEQKRQKLDDLAADAADLYAPVYDADADDDTVLLTEVLDGQGSVNISHEGGEFGAVLDGIYWSFAKKRYVSWFVIGTTFIVGNRKNIDYRTRRDRTRKRVEAAKRVIRRAAPDLEGTLGNSAEWLNSRDGRAGMILRPEAVDVYAKDSVVMLGHSDTAGVEPNPCEERGGWQNMVHDEDSKSWAIFDETGIFSCLCRHGCVLVATDMIQSGEL